MRTISRDSAQARALVEPAFQREQLQVLRAGQPAAVVGSAVITLVTAWVLVGAVRDGWLQAWVVAMMAALLFRLFLFYFLRESSQPANTARGLLWLRGGVLLTAIGWGLVPVFLFPQDLPRQTFLPFIAAGVCGAAVASLAIDRRAVLLVVFPVLVPLVVRLFATGGEIPLAMGLLVLAFLVFIVATTFRSEKVFRDVEWLRHVSAQQNAVLQAAQRLARLGNWSLDATNGKIEWSDETYEIYGRDPATFRPNIDIYYRELMHPEDVEAVRRKEQEAYSQAGKHHSIDHRICLPDGQERWVHIEGVATLDKEGKPLSISGTVQDITERKRAETALRESETRYRDTLDQAPALIWIADTENKGVWYNRRWREYTGRTMEQELGFGWIEGMHPDDRHRCATFCQYAFDRRERFEMEFRLRRVDGSYGWIVDTGIPRFAPDGSFEGYIGYCWDITDRKQAEEAVRESEVRLRYMLETSPIAARIAAGGGRKVIFSNRRYAELVNAGVHDASGLDPAAYYASTADYTDVLDRLARGESVYDRLVELRIPGAGAKWTLASYLPIYYGGEPAVLGWFYDITERKKIEQIKDEFISTVSHELRTPLTSIRGALGLLVSGAVGREAETTRDLLRIAYQNSERLSLLVNDILDAEKIASGKMMFDLKPQPLMPLLEQALAANQTYALQYGVTLRMSARQDDGNVRVDAERFQQVMANLLSNAIKYSPPGGVVEVSVSAVNNGYRVGVSDRGPGIPVEFRARVFEKFSQADASTTRTKGGTGLGLAITREIVERMQGRIGFESDAGRGTVFWVELPRAASRDAAALRVREGQ